MLAYLPLSTNHVGEPLAIGIVFSSDVLDGGGRMDDFRGAPIGGFPGVTTDPTHRGSRSRTGYLAVSQRHAEVIDADMVKTYTCIQSEWTRCMPDKPLTQQELDAIRHIRNALMHHGRSPSVRELQALLGYRSPRSASDVLERLRERGIVRRRADGKLQLIRDPEEDRQHARTVDVPLVGSAPCGAPLLAVENVETMIPVSVRLAKAPHRYFLLRAMGDSMDAAGINDGDLVLVRQQTTAEAGQRVVALIDDEATIKLFSRGKEVVILRPKSTNPVHKPVLLTKDFQVQGVVVGTIPKIT